MTPPKIENTDELLEEILYCLNQLQNRRVDSGVFNNTYEICSEIERHLEKSKYINNVHNK